MYLFPKNDDLSTQLKSVSHLITTSKHSLLTKMLIKKADVIKKRLKSYKFFKEGEEMTYEHSSDEWTEPDGKDGWSFKESSIPKEEQFTNEEFEACEQRLLAQEAKEAAAVKAKQQETAEKKLAH